MACFFKRSNTLAVVIATFVLCVFLPRQCPETPGCQSCGSLLRPRALNLSLCARHWSCRRRRHLWSCLWCTHKTEIYVEQPAADSLPRRSSFGSHGFRHKLSQLKSLHKKKKVRVAHEGHALTPTHRPDRTGGRGGETTGRSCFRKATKDKRVLATMWARMWKQTCCERFGPPSVPSPLLVIILCK